MQQLALEAQGVVHVGRLLLDHPVAGGDRFLQRTALDLLVDLAQHMLLEDCLDQAGLQLVGGKRLDQVVVGRQFGHRHNIGVTALAGDDQVDGGKRNEVGVAQFFEQLLAVAAVVEHEVGEHDIEAVGLDLANHLGRVAGAMHRRHPERRQHETQGLAGRRMAVDDQNPFFCQ